MWRIVVLGLVPCAVGAAPVNIAFSGSVDLIRGNSASATLPSWAAIGSTVFGAIQYDPSAATSRYIDGQGIFNWSPATVGVNNNFSISIAGHEFASSVGLALTSINRKPSPTGNYWNEFDVMGGVNSTTCFRCTESFEILIARYQRSPIGVANLAIPNLSLPVVASDIVNSNLNYSRGSYQSSHDLNGYTIAFAIDPSSITFENPLPFSERVTLSNAIGCGDYWSNSNYRCPGYEMRFDGNAITVSVDIGLRGDVRDDLVKTWEQGIESHWGSAATGERYQMVTDTGVYPIYFDVSFLNGLNPLADLYIDVADAPSGKDCWNTRNWYNSVSCAGVSEAFEDEAAAHEFGHYLGLLDEYSPIGTRCFSNLPLDADENKDCDGLMGSLSRPTLPRYYQQIANEFFSATGVRAVVGNLPINTPPQDYQSAGQVFSEFTSTSVPEPNSLTLVGGAVILALSSFGRVVRRRRIFGS